MLLVKHRRLERRPKCDDAAALLQPRDPGEQGDPAAPADVRAAGAFGELVAVGAVEPFVGECFDVARCCAEDGVA